MIKYLLISKNSTKKGEGQGYKKPGKDEYLWLFLIEPTEEEIGNLVKDFTMEKKMLDRYGKETHSVRYSMDPFQFVIVDYFIENQKIESAHLFFSIKGNTFILLSSKSPKFYHDLFERLSELLEKRRSDVKSIGAILNAFLQEDIEENYDVLQKTEEEITALEERVAEYEGSKSTSVKDILKMKRKLFKMGRRFWASTKIIFLLKAGFTSVKTDEKTSKLLVDVHDTFLHQIDIVSSQKEMLSDVMSVYSTSITNRLANVSNELNQIIKRLSSWGLILLLPTLIASIYGMNVELPLSNSQYAFHILVISMSAIILYLAFAFRKRGWL